jgi:RNA polymerase sigma-70 factor (ECF subfamily)
VKLAIDPIDKPESSAGEAPSAGPSSIVGGLFKSQAKKVRNFLAFRLKSSDDADDAAQDVFLKLWRYERSGNLREEATAYMFSAAYSVATDLERHRFRHQHEVLDDLDVAEGRPALEEERHWRDALAHLVSELKVLPEAHRKAFVLHHFKGLSYAQIAKKMGVSTRTVERHMIQAHKELESRMRDFL